MASADLVSIATNRHSMAAPGLHSLPPAWQSVRTAIIPFVTVPSTRQAMPKWHAACPCQSMRLRLRSIRCSTRPAIYWVWMCRILPPASPASRSAVMAGKPGRRTAARSALPGMAVIPCTTACMTMPAILPADRARWQSWRSRPSRRRWIKRHSKLHPKASIWVRSRTRRRTTRGISMSIGATVPSMLHSHWRCPVRSVRNRMPTPTMAHTRLRSMSLTKRATQVPEISK